MSLSVIKSVNKLVGAKMCKKAYSISRHSSLLNDLVKVKENTKCVWYLTSMGSNIVLMKETDELEASYWGFKLGPVASSN